VPGKQRRGIPKIPSIQPKNRQGQKPSSIYERTLLGDKPKPAPRQPTNWATYQRPEGFHRDKAGTWRVNRGMERLAGPTGKPGRDQSGRHRAEEYGFHRLFGQEAAEAYAQAKKNMSPAMSRRLDTWQKSGNIEDLLYYPTHSAGTRTIINTKGQKRIVGRRPRTQLAGYDSRSQTLFMLFSLGESPTSRDGAVYAYFGVPKNVWRMVRRNVSTGRTINRVLNAYPYSEIRPALK
jgi:hypothetical protein